MYKNYFFVFLLIVSFPCKAQFNAGSINTEKFYTELPFEYEHDKIVIEATMNGVKGRYLLDTGAMCILFKDSTEQELDVIQVMNVGDASGKKQKAEVIRLPIIEIGSLKYSNIPALYVDEFAGPFKCLGYKGLIGSNLLRFGAFKIDWDQQKIIIADSFQSIGCKVDDGVKMHVNKQQSSPFAKVKVNDKNIKWVRLIQVVAILFLCIIKLRHGCKKRIKLTRLIIFHLAQILMVLGERVSTKPKFLVMSMLWSVMLIFLSLP